MRSTEEVRRHLLAGGFPDSVIEEALARLSQQGLLDDDAFARAWTESRRLHRPRSRGLIRKELREKGITLEVADRATADIEDDATALELARRHAAHLTGLDRTTFLRRLSRYLYARGFSHATVARVLARLGTQGDVS
jgi:regulatory protein